MSIQTRSMTKKNSPVTKSPVAECLTKSLVTKSSDTKSTVTKSTVTDDSMETNSMETNNPVSICSVSNCFQLERPKNYTYPKCANVTYPEMISYITQEQYDSADFDKSAYGGYKNGYFIAACIPKIKNSVEDDIYIYSYDPDYIKGKTIYAVAGKGYFWDLKKISYAGYYWYLKKI